MESEEGERREKTKKRKRAEREEPKDKAPAAVSEEGASSEKRGGYEAYSKHPVLSPTTDQGAPAKTRVEERGKQRATIEERSTSELLILLKGMKKEMREREMSW